MKNRKVLRFFAASTAILLTALTASCSNNKPAEEATVTAAADTVPATLAATEAPTIPPTQAPLAPGEVAQGEVVTEDGVTRCYVNGVPQTDTVAGNEVDGYFYFGSDGTVASNYCDGINVNENDWIIIEGNAYRVETDSDKCLFTAAQDIGKCTDTGMSREDKLKAGFDYIKENYLEGVLHDPPYSYAEEDWPVVCANDIFVYGKGDCYSYGAAFAYYAKAIGYSEVYAVNSGGHGWTEVEERTYDPEWSMHSNNYSYYGMRYDEECDVPYAFAIENETDLKRRRIYIN